MGYLHKAAENWAAQKRHKLRLFWPFLQKMTFCHGGTLVGLQNGQEGELEGGDIPYCLSFTYIPIINMGGSLGQVAARV